MNIGPRLAQAGRAHDMQVRVEEVDMLKAGPRRNFLEKAVRKKLVGQVEAHVFDVIIASPPRPTLARSRGVGDAGPPPVRSTRFPRGFPWLGKAARSTVRDANLLVDFIAAVLRAHMLQGGVGLLDFPEDLGRVRQRAGAVLNPASIWRWPQVRSLLAIPGVTWGALYMEDFGAAAGRPTRFLTNLPGIESLLEVGEPRFSEEGDYLGPLPARAWPGAKRVADTGRAKIAPSSAWPASWCTVFSELVMRRLAARPAPPPASDKVPAEGEGQPGAPEPSRTSRRRISKEELALVRSGRAEELEGVYVGRASAPGAKPSRWSNPFRIGVHGTREGVVKLFGDWIVKDLAEGEVAELIGKTLLCHCGGDQTCHADVLCGLAEAERKRRQAARLRSAAAGTEKDHFKGNRDEDPVMLDFIDDGLPARRAVASRQDPVPVCPNLRRERKAEFMGRSRNYEDGGGLCSPGRVRKEQRRRATPLGAKILEQARRLFEESVGLRSDGKDAPLNFMLKLAAGRFEECPFDDDVVGKMVAFLQEALGLQVEDCGIAEGQSFRLKLIGALLHQLGDPDWEFFGTLEGGVPVGVGVALPRTPGSSNRRSSGPWRRTPTARSARSKTTGRWQASGRRSRNSSARRNAWGG